MNFVKKYSLLFYEKLGNVFGVIGSVIKIWYVFEMIYTDGNQENVALG